MNLVNDILYMIFGTLDYMSLVNDILHVIFGILGYIISFIAFLISLLAIHYKSIINGSTKYIVVMCLISLVYLSIHHGYMISDVKLPLDQEFEWRGFHLLVFSVFYAICLQSIQDAKPIILKEKSNKPLL